MIWLIVAAVLFGLFWLPIGIRAVYREENSGVWLLIGPFKVLLYPEKKEKKQSQNVSNRKNPENKKQGGSYTNFISIARVVLEFLSRFRRKLRVKNLELKLTLAGDDPADLAINYGRAWAAVGALTPQLERLLTIQKQDVQVLCDFVGDKTHVYAKIDATIHLGNLLYLFMRHGLKTFKHLFSSENLQKGGAQL